jgi:drug/metabolite transporter (DMT)-like permease
MHEHALVRQTRSTKMVTSIEWSLIVGGILLGSLGGIFFKLGAMELSHDQEISQIVWSAMTSYKIVLGFCLYLLPSFIWLYLLKKMDLSLLQPMFSLVYVLTPLLALLILKEQVSLQRVVGICIICAGVFVVSQS